MMSCRTMMVTAAEAATARPSGELETFRRLTQGPDATQERQVQALVQALVQPRGKWRQWWWPGMISALRSLSWALCHPRTIQPRCVGTSQAAMLQARQATLDQTCLWRHGRWHQHQHAQAQPGLDAQAVLAVTCAPLEPHNRALPLRRLCTRRGVASPQGALRAALARPAIAMTC